jgi:hypothetical protein
LTYRSVRDSLCFGFLPAFWMTPATTQAHLVSARAIGLQPRMLQVEICFRLESVREQQNLLLAEQLAGQMQRSR